MRITLRALGRTFLRVAAEIEWKVAAELKGASDGRALLEPAGAIRP